MLPERKLLGFVLLSASEGIGMEYNGSPKLAAKSIVSAAWFGSKQRRNKSIPGNTQ
jgi:hypothetical protein